MTRRRVLLCEPYATGSHRAWAEGLARHSRHEVAVVSHPGTSWKWRMQGAALTMAEQVDRYVARHGRPDVLVVSEMVHVPALLGLARRSLADVPVVVYLHENQLTYPPPEGTVADHTYAMTNWLSMAAADRVVFNSEFHRTAVLDALPGFLARFPDRRHDHRLAGVASRSSVLPIGVDPALFDLPDRVPTSGRVPLVLWNHRWEYDKAPEEFFGALSALADEGVSFQVAVAGATFRTVPSVFTAARERLGDRVVHFGTAERSTYVELLSRADVVVSTARHEFFGVAVVEAVAAGAMPVLPCRLAYPELVPTAEPYLYDDHDGLLRSLRRALTDPAGRRAAAARARDHAVRLARPTVAAAYDELVDVLASDPSAGAAPIA